MEVFGKVYLCVTCHNEDKTLDERDIMCEDCFVSCHQGHVIQFVGSKKFVCQCQFTTGLHCNLATGCSLKYTGKKWVRSVTYSCQTDGMRSKDALCGYCAKNCHSGHKISRSGHRTAFCDCPQMFTFCKGKDEI